MTSEMLGKVVLVTGASRGLGLQMARELASKQAKLILLDLPSEPWRGIAEELTQLGAQMVYTGSGDVTQLSTLQQSVDEAQKAVGPVDIVIANAGIGLDTTVIPFSIDSIRRQADINFVGVANTFATVIPAMIARKSGHLVATVSMSSYRGLPGMAGYCASKAAAATMMDSLRVDLKPYGICCTTLNPGWIRTGVLHTISAAKPGVTELPVAARKLVRGIIRRQPYVCFPLWLRSLFILNRLQPTSMGDWMLMKLWQVFGGAHK